LEAEQHAERMIQARRDHARATVNEALKAARAISDRTFKRITAVRTHCATSVKAQCSGLRVDFKDTAQGFPENTPTRSQLITISTRLAAKLTGGRDA
jgi:hypothetical protein